MKTNIVRESLSQRARSSPGVLRSSLMRYDALRGLTRQYRWMNGSMNPAPTPDRPVPAHLSPFQLQRKPRAPHHSPNFAVVSKSLPGSWPPTHPPQARARLERWESESRPASRQSPRRLSAWTMTRDDRCEAALHPSVFPTRCRPPVPPANFSPRNPHRIAGRRCSFGCARER